jgi:hypothetical protein
MTTLSLPPDAVPVEDLAGSATILAFRSTNITIQTRPTILLPTDFQGYISALPHWERKLLSSRNLTNIESLLAQLQEDSHLYIVSDGGAAGDCGSFGALVANAHSIFASLSGTTEGIEPGSYRAKRYGCLAILRLVFHLVTFHKLPPPAFTHTFYCDNKSLITRLTKADGPLLPFLRHFLRSDMDVEMQIRDTLRLLAINLAYKHVKGHQDDDAPTTALPREAILNIECDRLASIALATVNPSPTVQFFPASRITVTVDHITVNRKLPRSISRLVGKKRQRDC